VSNCTPEAAEEVGAGKTDTEAPVSARKQWLDSLSWRKMSEEQG